MPLDAPLKSLYASQDEIPETFRDLYEERGGQFHIAKIEGIKTDADVARIQRALDSEKTNHGTLKTAWGKFFGDKKPEDIQAQLDRIPELETIASSKNLNEDKLNELAEGRVRIKIAPIERQNQQLTTQLQEAQQQIEQFQARERNRSIQDGVRGEATKMKVVDSALEDVLMYAERVFDVQEDGSLLTKDGIQGVTPGLSPNVWLTEMQSRKPHWWPASKGGGAGGGIGSGNPGDNPWSHQGWNLTKQGQELNANPARAEQLAKAAGHQSAIGARRPPAPK
jgi:hypothetical protein